MYIIEKIKKILVNYYKEQESANMEEVGGIDRCKTLSKYSIFFFTCPAQLLGMPELGTWMPWFTK